MFPVPARYTSQYVAFVNLSGDDEQSVAVNWLHYKVCCEELSGSDIADGEGADGPMRRLSGSEIAYGKVADGPLSGMGGGMY